MKVLEYHNKPHPNYIVIEYENNIYLCFFDYESLRLHRFTKIQVKSKNCYDYYDLIGEHPQLIAELVGFTIQYSKLANICN